MHSWKSYLTPLNNSEVKEAWNTISRLHSFHILNIQGGDNKRPTERKQSKQYIIYKWSHAIILEKLKAIKSQNSLKKNNTYQSKVSKHEVLNCHKILSVRELKIKYISHTKGHYGIEDPKLKFKKGMQEDSYQKN